MEASEQEPPEAVISEGPSSGMGSLSGKRVKLLLAFSMFVMGACGIAYEYVLSVLGNYLIGSSHEEIFVVIGIMMFAMGVGSYSQRVFGGDLIAAFLGLEILLGLLGGFSASIVHATFAVSESYRVVLYGLAFSIGALIGMEIPIIIRINRAYSKSLRVNLAEVLSMDYVGALVGALLFAYVFLVHVSLTRIGYILGFANVAVAGIGLWTFASLTPHARKIGLALVVSLGLLVFGFFSSPRWDEWSEQRFFADPIVYRETTVYQHLVMTERNDVLSLYINGHLQFSSRDEHIYHEMLVHPAMTLAPRKERVLILGGGDGLAARECLKYPQVRSVTLVDIDPAIIALGRDHPRLKEINGGVFSRAEIHASVAAGIEPSDQTYRPMFQSQRQTQQFRDPVELPEVTVYTVDADQFLDGIAGTFDVAILDFPDPSQLETAKLFSREFYRGLERVLHADSLVAVQSASPYHAREVFLCIGETLRSAGYSVVPYHQNVPSFGEWGFHLATPRGGQSERLLGSLRSRARIPVTTKFLTPELVVAATHFGKDWLQSDRAIEPHTRLQPHLIEYYRHAWKSY